VLERCQTEQAAASGDPPLPLSGVRVLDFTTTLAGPSATRHLADFGADVIKVESSRHLDTARLGSPYAAGIPGPNRSGYFSAYNAGKRSLVLNLDAPPAREVVRRLVAVSDVLVESFTPGVLARRGLTYEIVRGWNPSIVMASHSLQGQSGPRSRQRGYGQLAAAMSGWFDITGTADRPPVGPYSAYTDFIAWPVLLAAILLALEMRDASGEGQYIDHAHMESAAYFVAPELVAAQWGQPPKRDGNREAYACPNNVYPCRGEDRWIAISVLSDGDWHSLCGVLGAVALTDDPRFADAEARRQHEDELDNVLAGLTAGWEAQRLADALADVGVAAGVVYRAGDLFADAQLAHRRTFRRLTHPELGAHAVVAPAFRLEGVDAGPRRPFPSLGEHTFEICTDLLGMDEDELAEYLVAGAFE
jgi:benzylsuccinate CoA-transferase BbsF subunit